MAINRLITLFYRSYLKFAVNQSQIQVVGYALYCKCGADASNAWNALSCELLVSHNGNALH